MGQKDIAEKVLEAYNDVFADIFNVLVFEGEPRIRPEELEDQPEKTAYKAAGKYHELERDVVKRWRKGSIRIACIGIENQTKSDTAMPIRVMAYDAADYRNQMNQGCRNQFYPVVSLVLYFGYEKPWNTATSLHEIMEIPEGMEDMVNDYRINLCQVAFLPEDTIEQFQSDFRIVADYFGQKRRNRDYIPTQTEIRHVQETLSMLSILTGDNRFEDALNEESQEGKELKNMCDVLDRIAAKGRMEGLAEGKREGLAEGKREGLAEGKREGLAEAIGNLVVSMKLTKEEAMNLLKIPEEIRGDLLARLS